MNPWNIWELTIYFYLFNFFNLLFNPVQVLDACSAPGNKTIHLAALMKGKGKIIACEQNKYRVKRLEDTIRLSGASSIFCGSYIIICALVFALTWHLNSYGAVLALDSSIFIICVFIYFDSIIFIICAFIFFPFVPVFC